jgi:hypothetical protein
MSSALDNPQAQEQEPRKERPKFEEFSVPPIGISPITGLPETPVWGAINKPHQASRWAIGDADSDDEYNFLPMGGSKQQIPGNGISITNLPGTLVWQTEIFLNGQYYIFSMLSGGHLKQTDSSGATTDIWNSAQFSQNGTLNGTTTVTALTNTGIMSVGQSVTGTNIPANTTITSIDSPTQIHISNAATGSGTFSLSFSTPLFTVVGVVDIAAWQATIVIISDSAAQKIYSWDGTNLRIIFNLQPVQYITVFGGRLWIGFNSTLQWTQGGTYNSLTGDSGSFLITENSCANPINCLLDTPYGLMITGSNWIKFATNFQDVGIPAVLTFQQNTLESQIGILTKWSVMVVGNVVFFGNTAGIWALNGGQPSQISAPFLNGFFANFDFTKTTLSAAYGMIFGTPCIFYQAYYKGDTQVVAGYRLLGYTLQGQQWFSFFSGTIVWISSTVSQSTPNNNPVVWATDGAGNIFQLFVDTTTAMNCHWNSKLWTFGSPLDVDDVLNVAVEFIATGPVTLKLNQLDETNTVKVLETEKYDLTSITIVNNAGNPITIKNNSNAAITIAGLTTATYNLFQTDGVGRCRRFGVNLNFLGQGTTLLGLTVSLHRTGASVGS